MIDSFDRDVIIVGEKLGLDPGRTILEAAGSVGEDPKSGKHQTSISGTKRELIVQIKVRFYLSDTCHHTSFGSVSEEARNRFAYRSSSIVNRFCQIVRLQVKNVIGSALGTYRHRLIGRPVPYETTVETCNLDHFAHSVRRLLHTCKFFSHYTL